MTFIPNPGRGVQSRPKYFRLISQILFMLKTLGRLVDMHIRYIKSSLDDLFI